jgi:hypothetical protein
MVKTVSVLLLLPLLAFSCTVSLPDGTTRDLSKMSLDENEPGDYVYRAENYDYFVNICGATSMNCGFM